MTSISVKYTPADIERLLAAANQASSKPKAAPAVVATPPQAAPPEAPIAPPPSPAKAEPTMKEKLIGVAKGCEEVFLTRLGFFLVGLVGGGFFLKVGVLGTGLYQLHDRATKARNSEGGIRTMFNAPLTKSEKVFLLTMSQFLGFTLLPNGVLLVGAASFLLTGVKPRYDALNRVNRLCIKPQRAAITDQTPILTVAKTGFNMAKHTSAAVFDPAGSLALQEAAFAPPKETFVDKMVAKAGPTLDQVRKTSMFSGFMTATASNPGEKAPSFWSRLFKKRAAAPEA